MPHFLIAPDKFKGTLSALEVASAIEDGLRSALPADVPATFELLPIADGGEGTTESLGKILNARLFELPTMDALGRPCMGEVGLADSEPGSGKGDLGIMEIAAAAGLWRIKSELRNPWGSSTYGVGMLLKGLAERGARRILVGLGGSATNDAGFGMASALGYRFYGVDCTDFPPFPGNWSSIEKIAPPQPPDEPLDVDITVLCDVTNPLLGPRGASHVYGPQKGVTDPAAIDTAMQRMADIVTGSLGSDYRNQPGAGAAGGLGYGFLTFTRAKLVEGFRTIAELTHLEEAVRRADIVITGEGRIDTQTFSGKGPSGIAALAVKHGKPVHLFCGKLDEALEASDLEPAIKQELNTWSGVYSLIGHDVSASDALANSKRVLRMRASQLAKRLSGQIAK
ncbi:MAG: glycerate kinase [Candidatus Methylacidiphilales bacterium]|nr:glycerate kinase [Candidatus Methylacidiphilales bacterium]